MKKQVSIIGSGPSALMLAAMLDENLFDVTIYEKNTAPARKFLVAGDGGFNLTHSEELENFTSRYSPEGFFKSILSSFTNTDFREWLHKIGIETFVGTSKRVFPVKGIKPIDVLNAILNELERKGVTIKTGYKWIGWKDDQLVFEYNSTNQQLTSDISVFALGGSSWKVTGSDGSWLKHFEEKGISTVPFQASNCAFEVKWKDDFLKAVEGKALKNIAVSFGSKQKLGELVITKFGIEGGVVYAMSPQIRGQLNKGKSMQLNIDLKPNLTLDQIKDKFRARGNRSIKKMLEDRLSFNEVHLELLKTLLTKEEFTDPEILAEKIKKLSITISSSAPMDDAISTVGGIDLNSVDDNFQLKQMPGIYCIGEMLDWDAPTGGYLLQGCFSMGAKLASSLNKSL